MRDEEKGHTVERFDGELENIQRLLLEMGARVLVQIEEALRAFEERDVVLAERVIDADREIDRMEVAADREIIEVLARRCPVGGDLRLVMAVSKGVSDLERIGDEAARLAGLVRQVQGAATEVNGSLRPEINGMGQRVLNLLEEALTVFQHWDVVGARRILAQEPELEAAFESELRKLMTFAMADWRDLGLAIAIVLIIKSLTRIGHKACNLAEHVVFKVEGEDVRAV